MKKIITFSAIFIICFTLICGCASDNGQFAKDKDAPSGYEESMRVYINQDSVHEFSYFGAEIYPEMFMEDDFSDADIANLENKIKEMGITNIRIGIDTSWYEPDNDNYDVEDTKISKFTFESDEMKAFYNAYNLARETGSEVTLVIRGIKAKTWLGYVYEDCERTAPNNSYEYLENVMTLLKYLDETGVQIDYLTIQDKANETWVKDTGPCIPTYYECAELIGNAILKSSLKIKPKLILSDDNGPDLTWFGRNTQKNSKFAYAYSFHSDFLGRKVEMDNLQKAVTGRAELIKANDPGKNLIVSSFGFTGEQAYGENDFNENINLSVFIEQLLSGASGMIYRNICDFTYNGETRNDGLFGSRETGFSDKNYTEILRKLFTTLNAGDKIYSVSLYELNDESGIIEEYKEGDCSCIFIEGTDGKCRLIFTNCGSLYAKKITLFTEKNILSVKGESYTENGYGDVSSITFKNGKIYTNIPYQSFGLLEAE